MIWVIEILDESNGIWLPCAAAYLTRAAARWEKEHEWERNNPHAKFRVRKYIAA